MMRRNFPLVTIFVWVLLSIIGPSAVFAQNATVEDILKQKSQWKKFADEGRKVTIEARFQGRAADSFHVEKMDIDFRLPGRIRLPDRMRDDQRLTITGKFVSNNSKISFQVSALAVLDTDLEHLAKQVAAVPENQPDQLLTLADFYTPIADFYGDEDLAAGDPAQLRMIYETAVAMKVDRRLIDAIGFEVLVNHWQRNPQNATTLIAEVKQLPGWDQPAMNVDVRLKQGFSNTAVESYNNAADAERRILHRLLYTALRQLQIQGQLKSDGSNGLVLADLIRTEFPDDDSSSAVYEEREVEYRLSRVPDLTRLELQQLIELLDRLSRQDATSKVISQWLTAQERRFGTVELAGILRIADEHLFVAEQWKDAAHHSRGIELLKQAWTVASTESPADGRVIAERLARLGWERLNEQWMTTRQVQMLPKDDIQLAIREGRVVRGMTVAQVTKTLGQPTRISRLGSSRTMRELWIYDGDGAAGLVVRFRRSVVTKSDENTVEDVSRIPSGR
jgi:hypothetical protein